ncbi:MAG: ABC-three component system protein, partial [bacterium]
MFDDVGVTTGDGQQIAEQTKSTGRRNPIADKSVELWKTLGNWVEAARTGEIDPAKCNFDLHLSQTRHGSIAESFNDANDSDSALAA